MYRDSAASPTGFPGAEECMANARRSEMTTAQLESKLRTLTAIQRTVIAIFAIIIATWLLMGLWRNNVPVFISTLVLAVGVSVSQLVVRNGLRQELDRRQSATR